MRLCDCHKHERQVCDWCQGVYAEPCTLKELYQFDLLTEGWGDFCDLMMDEFVEAITELYDNQIEAIQGLMQTNKQLSKCVAYLDDLRNIKNLPENKRVERLAGWLKAEEF